jgi:hypothetical protein
MTDHLDVNASGENGAPSEANDSVQPIAEVKSQAERLLLELKGTSEQAVAANLEIEKSKDAISASKAEIEGHLTAASQLSQQLRQLVEAAHAAVADLNTARTAAQNSGTQVGETSAQVGAILESMRGTSQAATEAANRAEAARVQIEQIAGVVATKSEHIEGGRVHADEVRSKIDNVLTLAQQAATGADAQLQASQRTAESLTGLLTAAQTTRASIDANGEAISTLRTQSDRNAEVTKRLAETAEATEGRIKVSESSLDELRQTAATHLRTIENLLLGATNAGLAHAFDKRSKTFQRPERFWTAVFFGSLGALLAVAVVEALSQSGHHIPEYSELARLLLNRLPFFVPLVWLAIYASRQAALAKRMEEEYAFKATISTSFEGYRRQMAEVGELSERSPLALLCTGTIRTIGAPPGQVYEKQRMDPTPGTAAAEIIAPVADGVSKAVASRIPTVGKS